MRIPNCTGVLVAGGQASRLGGLPKGLLAFEGEQLAARALRIFRDLFDATLLVANDGEPYRGLGAPIVPDVIQGKGAPGGLHAALSAAGTEWVFTAGCDMPRLSAGPIAWLWARRGDAPAVAVVWKGRLQPLHAFWSRECLPTMDRMLRDGDPSLWKLASAVGARFVTEEEWRAVDPEGAAFENVNTPGDAARLGIALPSPFPTAT
jgi:molybdopterin-guanine dinucleotide biosynthesis protein A